ncbi:hypothetical protein [Photobacterium leiognathi]
MTLYQKLALGLGGGLMVGSLSTILPTFQFFCFVVGLMLWSSALVTKTKS